MAFATEIASLSQPRTPSATQLRIPPPGSSPETLRAFLDRQINYESPIRIERMRTWELARLMYANLQWLEEDLSWGSDPTHSPFLRPMQVTGADWFPMPVCNELTPAIQNDVVRLVQRGTRGHVRADDSDPRKVRAAKVGWDVLNDRLRSLDWAPKDHDWCHQISLYGTGVLKAWVDFDSTRTVPLPLKGALQCPECDFKLASPDVEDDDLESVMGMAEDDIMVGRPPRAGVETAYENDVPTFSASVTRCLTCPAAPAAPLLVPFEPPVEALSSRPDDYFGRPLYEDVPLVDVDLRVVPTYDYFPQNNGVGRIADFQERAEAHIETLEWIRAHYANGVHVKADNPWSMLRWHPLLGGSYTYGGSPLSDPTLYKNHAVVKEFHCGPYLDENGEFQRRGRSIVMANNVVLLDGDYLIPSRLDPERTIKRCVYLPVQWDLRDGLSWGLSCAELLMPTQVRINVRLSQVETVRHLWANPRILAEEGADLMFQGGAELGDYQGSVLIYRPQVGGEAPTLFPTVQLDGRWVEEHRIDVQNMKDNAGIQDADVGQPPGGGSSPWAASALMFLGQRATIRRQDRLARIRDARQRLFSYILEVVHEFYREPRYYRVRGRNDRWDVKSFRGTDLLGQTSVVIDEQAVQDDVATRALIVGQAVSTGGLTPSSASDKRKINAYLGLPSDINEEENLQVEVAEEEWFAFRDEGTMPAVKVHDDSHQIHFQQHQADWLRDDCRQMRDEVDWNQVELALEGWEVEFDALLAKEAEFRVAPPSPQPPPVVFGPTGPTPESVAAQLQWRTDEVAAQVLASLPKALELRLHAVWLNTLEARLPELSADLQRFAVVEKLLRFHAHKIAHMRVMQQQMMGAAPTPAPVAGPSTPEGTVPGLGQEAVPGGGAGPGTGTAGGEGAVV